MKRYILFGFSLLMAFPASTFAQDDLDDEEEVQEFNRVMTVKQVNYETRNVRGYVLDATTKQPIAGAIVRAAEIDGYSVLTEDNGSYELKLPLFTSALYISTPDYNPVRIGLVKGDEQKTAYLIPQHLMQSIAVRQMCVATMLPRTLPILTRSILRARLRTSWEPMCTL